MEDLDEKYGKTNNSAKEAGEQVKKIADTINERYGKAVEKVSELDIAMGKIKWGQPIPEEKKPEEPNLWDKYLDFTGIKKLPEAPLSKGDQATKEIIETLGKVQNATFSTNQQEGQLKMLQKEKEQLEQMKFKMGEDPGKIKGDLEAINQKIKVVESTIQSIVKAGKEFPEILKNANLPLKDIAFAQGKILKDEEDINRLKKEGAKETTYPGIMAYNNKLAELEQDKKIWESVLKAPYANMSDDQKAKALTDAKNLLKQLGAMSEDEAKRENAHKLKSAEDADQELDKKITTMKKKKDEEGTEKVEFKFEPA